ncbi:methenyltetrahydrofolate cyclohydrolase [Paenibacillus polymyxa]|uniref:cyclodeaminase/cyclohydrolase family protein n=1 Tax=Paenibacillus polymyxa TaxID=1406 RepID=UPI00042F0CA6|nr:cyclodeaminase/cyclohydrolase family protein [Paenibacillus polymyxa]AHM64575.1 formiminotransferase-cyclodeaminase [Paenibacillus polymyxa SQR-21]AIY10216.1 methenyltetrahydrofolate cyclohydrolase [Paenibacillus polymyxa]RGL34888.1 methenyltetrahydrofolate cyclohydrolase [Paenibacillus polymyxa]UMR36685.1 cyclodeaminase/cyclohydrolase family protein [Paenibacillus polymyxa]
MSELSWNQSIAHFLKEAASAAPTPGGGSVSALAAALGAAMTSMTANLSQGEKYTQFREQMVQVISSMERLSTHCEELMAADIQSFEQYMTALRLPKETDEEKRYRTHSLQTAVIAAIEVPMRLLEVCRDGLSQAYNIVEISNKNVISDLGIGAILFEAAAQSALLTIDINLASLKDLDVKQSYEAKTATLLREIGQIKEQTLLTVRSRIASS